MAHESLSRFIALNGAAGSPYEILTAVLALGSEWTLLTIQVEALAYFLCEGLGLVEIIADFFNVGFHFVSSLL